MHGFSTEIVPCHGYTTAGSLFDYSKQYGNCKKKITENTSQLL
jgi:hypothetical protein